MTTAIDIHKKNLNKIGFNNLEEWITNPNHLYIGRNNVYVKGANGSKWQNPYKVKKYGLDKSLELYENYIRTGELYSQLNELNDKILGCWCHPNKCHGDVLCYLLKEKKEKYNVKIN